MITRASRASTALACVLLALGPRVASAEGSHKTTPLVGVKIYETKRKPAELFREWRELGIDTVFASAALNLDPAFQEEARRAGVARFVILPTFFDPDALKADPALYAITTKGEKASEEWVTFVCPSRAAFRARKLDVIKKIVRDADPDGLSIDFIRHFVFWEKVYPDRTPESLPNTCFDKSCVEAFQKAAGVRVPAELKTPSEIAAWIAAHHLEAWTEWKCGLISSMVREIAEQARALKPGIQINVHAVPWRRPDFGGGIRRIAGQDFREIAKHVDYVSPMTYAHMVKQGPSWVHSVVEDLAAQLNRPILPSIQVGKAYIETPLTMEEFTDSLKEALKPPSRGVVLWSWQALEDEPAKKKALKGVLSSAAYPRDGR